MIITLPPQTGQAPGTGHASGPSSYLLHERAEQFHGAGVGYLSIKSFFLGQATYRVGPARYAVNDRAYLVLNHGQSYDITVEAAAPVDLKGAESIWKRPAPISGSFSNSLFGQPAEL